MVLLLLLLVLLCWLGYELFGLYTDTSARYAYSQPRQLIEDPARSPKVLMLGNSLTYAFGIPAMTEHLVQQLSPAWKDALITSIAPSGHHLSEHLEELDSETGFLISRDIRHALDPARPIAWHTVVLQDGSQVMNTRAEHPIRRRAMRAIPELGARIARSGARPMLYVTWGYSPTHTRGLTPEQSSAMTARIAQGYEQAGELADARLAKMERQVDYLPAGEAFEQMRTRHPELYPKLFVDDRHPSQAGAYLVACLLAARLTGEHVEPATWHPPQLSTHGALTLRQIADQVIWH